MFLLVSFLERFFSDPGLPSLPKCSNKNENNEARNKMIVYYDSETKTFVTCHQKSIQYPSKKLPTKTLGRILKNTISHGVYCRNQSF